MIEVFAAIGVIILGFLFNEQREIVFKLLERIRELEERKPPRVTQQVTVDAQDITERLLDKHVQDYHRR